MGIVTDIILPIGVAISELVNPRYTPQVINKGKFTQIIEEVSFLERKLFEKKADDKYRGSVWEAENRMESVHQLWSSTHSRCYYESSHFGSRGVHQGNQDYLLHLVIIFLFHPFSFPFIVCNVLHHYHAPL